jgi:hypothetical protein
MLRVVYSEKDSHGFELLELPSRARSMLNENGDYWVTPATPYLDALPQRDV